MLRIQLSARFFLFADLRRVLLRGLRACVKRADSHLRMNHDAQRIIDPVREFTSRCRDTSGRRMIYDHVLCEL